MASKRSRPPSENHRGSSTPAPAGAAPLHTSPSSAEAAAPAARVAPSLAEAATITPRVAPVIVEAAAPPSPRLSSISAEAAESVPSPLSAFVGRREALEQIAQRFAEESRFVTIWGTAGMGKTRLAIEHARALRSAGEAVVYVPLAERGDVAAACGAIARACGVATDGVPQERVQALAGRALAVKGRVLLVLDNLEHLLPAIAPLITSWLERAPSARLLATSRERTGQPGEAAIELSPLSLSASEGAASEAATLFLLRAREQRPLPPLDAEATARVGELVRALEGIPLAIELAAARFDVLGLDGLAARLGSRLDVLSRPRLSGDRRTSTLRGAIEWSWSLLGDEERVALARCSVFRASFTLEAAAAVLAGLGAPAFELVQALRDKSLLRSWPAPDALAGSRFALYEGVRELAAEKLAQMPGEAALTAELYTRHTLETGEAHAARFARTGEVSALLAIAREMEHLLAVVARAPTSIDALRALVVMDPVVTTQRPEARHLERLEAALRGATGAPPLLLARAIGARGRARMFRGMPRAEAEPDLERALALAVAAGDRMLEAELSTDLGVLAHRAGDLGRAKERYERALAADRAAGGSRAEGRALGNLGALHHDAHRLDEALEHYERALSILTITGDLRLEGIVSTNLGTLEQEHGSMSAAKRRYERAAALLAEVGDVRLLGITLGNLGLLHHEEGRLDEARFCHEQSLQKLAIAGDRASEGLAFARLSAVLAALGRLDEARVALHRGARAAGEPSALFEGASAVASGFVDLALARRAREERRAEAAAAHLAKARARIEHARAPAGPDQPSPADRSDDVRTLLRILSRAVSATGGSGPGEQLSTAGGGAPEQAMLLAPGARWLRMPGGPWRDLRRRGLARKLLLRLVEHQREAPGAGVSLEALREAAWPGERMTLASAANRLHVALHQLRSLGVEQRLVRTHDGYLLDPTLPVYHVTVEPAAEDAGS
jgi:predicted ATPase